MMTGSERMTREQALEGLLSNDLLQLGMDADEVRQELWPEAVVTYSVGVPVAVGGGVRLDALQAAVERGAMGLVCSALPGAGLGGVLTDLSAIHERFPGILLTGFSVGDIAALGDAWLALGELAKAGLACFGNGPAASDEPPAGDAWVVAHRAAHTAGLPSVAVLILRSSDSAEDRVAWLERVADLQNESLAAGRPGFLACEARIERMERALDEVTGAQYLKMVSLSRLFLRTVPHVQVDWSIFGPKVLQVALRCGADDAGLVVASERDRRVPSHHSGEEELRRILRDAGFEPVQRDAVYGRSFVY